ncbi:MAG: diguanylate cyclase [Pseudonocardiaceae bacterium]|nr:diguanylate cyclase [Pseudonocardiaceae bacterium]
MPTPGDRPGLVEFARRWTDSVLDTSLVSISRPEARDLFMGLAEELSTALSAEEPDASAAARVGEQLVANNFIGSTALSRTLQHLGTELIAVLPQDHTDGLPERLHAVQAGLIEGYLAAMREQLFERQETIKKAALRAQVKAERARAASQAQFGAVFASADVGIAVGDVDGKIVQANGALERMLGRESGGLAGVQFHELASEFDAQRVRDGFAKLKSGELPRFRAQIDLRRNTDDDEPISARIALTLVADGDHEQSYPVLVLSDITDLHLLQERISYQAVHDPLTGLPNKSRFSTHLETVLAAAARTGEQIGLCFLDIDGFKVVQDGLGPQIGDQVLQSVANRLSRVFRRPDTLVARMTGDGFAVVVGGADVTTPLLIQLVDEALRELAEPVYFDGQGVAISVSVAIVVQAATDYTAIELIRAAEITLHRAKKNGKAQWMLFDPKLDAGDRARYRLGAGIGGALENGELAMDFQPLPRLGASSEGLYAVAAVPRWDHPELGSLSSEEFGPLAVETGQMLPVGRWLMEHGCAQAAEWQRRFGATTPPVRLRLPERLMRDEDLVGYVMREIERTGLDSAGVQIQLPPTAVADEHGELLDSLQILHERGIRLVLDVAGTAELDLIHRHKLPVHGVHLSADLVHQLAAEPDDGGFVARNLAHLIAQARTLDLTVTAQDVPTTELARRLHGLGVTAASGPFAAEPGPAEEISALIERVPSH